MTNLVDLLPDPNDHIVIEVIDLNHGKVRLNRKVLKPIFSGDGVCFQVKAFIQGKNKLVEKCFVNRANGSFGLGSLNRVRNHLRSKGFKTRTYDPHGFLDVDDLFEDEHIMLGSGVSEFDHQKKILRLAKKHGRGQFVAATGSGKSFGQYLIAKNVKGNTLVLCHSIDIVNQLYKGSLPYFDKDDCVRMDSSWDREGKVCFCVNKSALLIPRKKIFDYFDCIIVDEAHRFSSEYEEFFEYMAAPLRFSFTATPPEDDRKISLEKFFGDILLKLDTQWGIDKGILTPPTVVVVKGQFVFGLNDQKYQQIYKGAVTQNIMFNRDVAKVIDFCVKTSKSFLCMVISLEHGENIARIVQREFGHDIPFMHGKSTKSDRENVQAIIRDRTLPGAICTNIWEAGIDIQNLDCAIIAFNGKVDQGVARVPQFLGRALRKADGKDKAYVFDFTAKNKYLAEHFVSRLEMYLEEGWDMTTFDALCKEFKYKK